MQASDGGESRREALAALWQDMDLSDELGLP